MSAGLILTDPELKTLAWLAKKFPFAPTQWHNTAVWATVWPALVKECGLRDEGDAETTVNRLSSHRLFEGGRAMGGMFKGRLTTTGEQYLRRVAATEVASEPVVRVQGTRRNSRVRVAAAVAVGAVAFLAGLVGAAPFFGGGVQGTAMAAIFALIVFVVALVVMDRGGDQGVALPLATLPERPSDFGFLKWWEFRRALNRAREVTRAEVHGELLDSIVNKARGGEGQMLSEVEIIRRLEAREREVFERFGFRIKEPRDRKLR